MPEPTWKRKERDDTKWLLKVDGPDPQFSKPMQAQVRAVAQITALQRDQQTRTYVGESKRRELASWIKDAIAQIRRIAQEEGKDWVLFLHLKGEGEPVHVISRENHERLLEYRNRVEQAEARVRELEAQLEEYKALEQSPLTDAYWRLVRKIKNAIPKVVHELKQLEKEASDR